MMKLGLILGALAVTNVAGQSTSNATIASLAANTESLSTLTNLLGQANLVGALSGSGNFTVFAPTNTAFGNVPSSALTYLQGNTTALTQVLLYHVYATSAILSTDLSVPSSTTLTMMNGAPLTVNVLSNGTVTLNTTTGGTATVTTANVQGSNGVVHIIDAVLVPAGVLPAVTTPTTTTKSPESNNNSSSSSSASRGLVAAVVVILVLIIVAALVTVYVKAIRTSTSKVSKTESYDNPAFGQDPRNAYEHDSIA
eukprot:m.141191 g.141191  ORF g.141191 m.141191 type:complete len:254 (+) comp11554_c0_seq5:113-874(+)